GRGSRLVPGLPLLSFLIGLPQTAETAQPRGAPLQAAIFLNRHSRFYQPWAGWRITLCRGMFFATCRRRGGPTAPARQPGERRRVRMNQTILRLVPAAPAPPPPGGAAPRRHRET